MSENFTDEEFEAAIKKLSAKSKSAVQKRKDESKTIHSIILPFMIALGYDIYNDDEVVPEFNADVGTKTREKVDYALIIDGKPIILIEAKASTSSLNASHQSQLFRYFTTTDVKIGILTNGVEMQFYSDFNKANVMDDKPFFRFDFQKIGNYEINFLKLFRKKRFSVKKIMEQVQVLQNADDVKDYIRNEIMVPNDDFLQYIGKAVLGRRLKKGEVPNFYSMIKTSFAELLDEGNSLKETIMNSRRVVDAPKPRKPRKTNDDDSGGNGDDDDVEKLCQKYRSAVKTIASDVIEHENAYGFSYNKRDIANRFALIEKKGDRIRISVLLEGHTYLHGFTHEEPTGNRTPNFYADVNMENDSSALQDILSGVKKAYEAMRY